MRKIIIKLPDERVKKFRLQREGWIGIRSGIAATILRHLQRAFSCKKLKEKTMIVVKEVDRVVLTKGGRKRLHFIVINQSLASDNPAYLMYIAACFLEDYLSKESFAALERRYSDYER